MTILKAHNTTNKAKDIFIIPEPNLSMFSPVSFEKPIRTAQAPIRAPITIPAFLNFSGSHSAIFSTTLAIINNDALTPNTKRAIDPILAIPTSPSPLPNILATKVIAAITPTNAAARVTITPTAIHIRPIFKSCNM